ncbi:hypothetical protein [Kitasatospora griseola]
MTTRQASKTNNGRRKTATRLRSGCRDLASVETTAGWHFSGGSDEGVFGHSATLLVAASRRHPAGHPRQGQRVGRNPQLALGLVLDAPGRRIGPNAIQALDALALLGLRLPVGLLAADRAYTDQKPAHFALPARRLGYQLVLDYKQDQRGIQGTHHGALLVDGTLACPAMPEPLATVTTGLNDRHVRDLDDQQTSRIAAREPYFLKLKQSPDPRGAIRLQCPAAGPSPSVTCPRFARLHSAPATSGPAVIDLTNARSTAAHPRRSPPSRSAPPNASGRHRRTRYQGSAAGRPSPSTPAIWANSTSSAKTGTTSAPPGTTPTGPSGPTTKASTAAPRATASTSPSPRSVSLTAARHKPSSSL